MCKEVFVANDFDLNVSKVPDIVQFPPIKVEY